MPHWPCFLLASFSSWTAASPCPPPSVFPSPSPSTERPLWTSRLPARWTCARCPRVPAVCTLTVKSDPGQWNPNTTSGLFVCLRLVFCVCVCACFVLFFSPGGIWFGRVRSWNAAVTGRGVVLYILNFLPFPCLSSGIVQSILNTPSLCPF